MTGVLALGMVVGLFLCTGCARSPYLEPEVQAVLEAPAAPAFYTEESSPTCLKLAEDRRPAGVDGASWKALEPSLRDCLRYAARREAGQVAVAHGDTAVTWGEIAETLTRLLALLPRLDQEPTLLAEQFRWLRLTKEASFSGYYEPVIKASRFRTAEYSAPLYKVPADLKRLDLGTFQPDLVGRKLVYRTQGAGTIVPYHDRAAIDALNGGKRLLRGKGLELAWADPVDAYFLQVQGSGRLRFDDGKEIVLRYAADNGQPYFSIGKYLAAMNELPGGKASMQSLRRWLREHPAERNAVFARNPRYIFFRKDQNLSGPRGAMSLPLVPMNSLAVDREVFPLGAVLAFDVPLPDPGENSDFAPGAAEVFRSEDTPGQALASRPFRGIGLAQDTGGAIRGNRIDLFCGRGARAAFVAGHLNAPGDVWMLLAR